MNGLYFVAEVDLGEAHIVQVPRGSLITKRIAEQTFTFQTFSPLETLLALADAAPLAVAGRRPLAVPFKNYFWNNL